MVIDGGGVPSLDDCDFCVTWPDLMWKMMGSSVMETRLLRASSAALGPRSWRNQPTRTGTVRRSGYDYCPVSAVKTYFVFQVAADWLPRRNISDRCGYLASRVEALEMNKKGGVILCSLGLFAELQ